MKLKYLGLFTLLFTTCLVACNESTTSSESTSTSTTSQTQYSVEDVYNIRHVNKGYAEQIFSFSVINTVESEIKDNMYYQGSTYVFRFYFSDQDNKAVLIDLDYEYLSYDEEYLKLTKLSDAFPLALEDALVINGRPTFYIEMLKPCDMTTLSINLPNVTYSLDFNIIEVSEEADVYKKVTAYDVTVVKDLRGGGVYYIHDVEDYYDNFNFMRRYITIDSQRNEEFFNRYSYLILYLNSYLYSDYAYMDSFIDYNNNLTIRLKGKINIDADTLVFDSYKKLYIFRVGKDFVDYDVSISISPDVSDDRYATGA